MDATEQFNYDMGRIEIIINRWIKLKAINAPQKILNNERALLHDTMLRVFDIKNYIFFQNLTERGIQIIKMFNQYVNEIKPNDRLTIALEDENTIIDLATEIINEKN